MTASTTLTPRQLDQLAAKVADKLFELISESKDEMIPLETVVSEKGLSKTYLYHHHEEMGSSKVGKKIFFSRRNLELFLRNAGKLPGKKKRGNP